MIEAGDEENLGTPEAAESAPEATELSTHPGTELPEAGVTGALPSALNPEESSSEGLPTELPDFTAAPEAEASEPADDLDPNLNVDELLSGEMLPELGELLPEPAADLPLEAIPTFQLQFLSLTKEQIPEMKKALTAHGVEIQEKIWASATPVISQLNEYQAVSLLQVARALGALANATVQYPDLAPSEDELALGDLSAIPDPENIVLESAPSVVLPKGEKEVMLCTPDAITGANVLETMGIIIAHRSMARRLFREEEVKERLEKEIKLIPKLSATVQADSQLQVLMRELLLDLRKNALAKGANAVLGVKLEAFPEAANSDPQLEQLRLVAFGTAAVVEKA